MIFFKLLSSEDALINLIFQKPILAQHFTTSLKLSKATNRFKLSLWSRGSPNHEAPAQYCCTHNRSKRLHIIPKYGFPNFPNNVPGFPNYNARTISLLTSENVSKVRMLQKTHQTMQCQRFSCKKELAKV